MNRIYRGMVFIFIILFLLSLPLVVVATESNTLEINDSTVTEVEKEAAHVDFKEVDGIVGLYQEDKLIMLKDSEQMKNLEDYIINGVREEFTKGLLGIKNLGFTSDHIEMRLWGDFLYKYLNKTTIDMPSDSIIIDYGDITYEIRGNTIAKEWIEKDIIPFIKNNMREDSNKYPVEHYRIALGANKRWVEVETIDVKNKYNLELVSVEYPMVEDTSTYLVYNTGTVYGVMLNSKYVEVMRGYNGELEYTERVESEKPATVSTLVSVVYLKNLEGATLEGKSFYDMSIYDDLAVDITTKVLTDKKELKEEKTPLVYKDYNLKEEELILVNLKDSTVLVQSVYLECFKWGNREYNTGTWVDFSGLLIGDSTNVKFESGTIPVSTYQDNGDILNTQLGKRSPFLIFASANNLPFDRLLKWIHSDVSVGEMPEEQKEDMQEAIKNIMYEQGRKEEYKEYLKAAGVSALPFILIAVFIVGILVGALVYFYLKNKNKKPEKEIDMSDLLFDTQSPKDDNTEDEDNLF